MKSIFIKCLVKKNVAQQHILFMYCGQWLCWLCFALVLLCLHSLCYSSLEKYPINTCRWCWGNCISMYWCILTVTRFFYDGFKVNRYYWEILILIRKFLIVVFIIIFRSILLYQIYGMTLVVQAGEMLFIHHWLKMTTALLIHILFHPYISGRQFRLELWSLLAMLITLFASLYVDQVNQGVPAVVLSGAVLVLHVVVVLGTLHSV